MIKQVEITFSGFLTVNLNLINLKFINLPDEYYFVTIY